MTNSLGSTHRKVLLAAVHGVSVTVSDETKDYDHDTPALEWCHAVGLYKL